MRSLLFLSCAFMFANALDKALIDELKEEVQKKGIECAEQEHPPQADIELMMNNELPNSHEGKCTIFCVLKKFNIMKDAVTTGPGDTKWLEKAQADDSEFYANLLEIYEICGPKVKLHDDDGCENAFELTRCFREESPKHGLDKMMGQ